jgi:glycosyltransferase involved in cell wall biosynthesis
MEKFLMILRALKRYSKKTLSGQEKSISQNVEHFRKHHTGKMITNRLDNSDVSIVVPCYNHSTYLDSTFSCLIHQTFRPFDVIFVEDHSTDDTLSHLEELCQQFPPGINYKILRTARNSGQSNAINLGVSSTTSSIVMVLNDDDYLMHDAVEASVEIMRSQKDIYLFGSTSIWFSGIGDPIFTGEPLINISCDYQKIPLKKFYPEDVIRIKSLNDINMTHSSSVFLKNAWKSVGGYYPDRRKRVVQYADRDFQLRIASLYPIAISSEIPFVFWRDDSSVDSQVLS